MGVGDEAKISFYDSENETVKKFKIRYMTAIIIVLKAKLIRFISDSEGRIQS